MRKCGSNWQRSCQAARIDTRLYGCGSGKAKLPLPSSAIAARAVLLWLLEQRIFISKWGGTTTPPIGCFVLREKNGKKYFRITRTIGKKSDGTPIKKEFYGNTKSEAEEKANKWLQDIDNGLNPNYRSFDINTLVDMWLYNIKIKDSNFKPSSFTKYEGLYRNYIKDSDIGYLKIFNCQTLSIQKYFNKLSERGKKRKSDK